MKNKFLLTALLVLQGACAWAQKEIYIPREWRNRTDTLIWAESDPNNEYTWSRSRSKETDNVIILWDKYYGNTNPSDASYTYRVDIDDLSAKCEEFFQLECDSLGFVDPETSNLSKYKVMVLLNHSADWICYGGGYDYQVPALWLSPSTCKPVGSAVAHEMGHSFHYMCYSEDSNHGANGSIQTGFHGAVGNGATVWEITANWQALQSYPNEMFTESGFSGIYSRSHNYAFTHEWHRYQAYMFFYYLCHTYGTIHAVADVWNHRVTQVMDFNQVLMDLKGLSVEELYKLHFDYAMHAVTWDLPVWSKYRSSYIGNFDYYCVNDGPGSYQVAYQSAPQGTGFNVIPLKVPAEGTQVDVEFTALGSASKLLVGDPSLYFNENSTFVESGKSNYNGTGSTRHAFRIGFVLLKRDGTREYVTEDSLYCDGRGNKTEYLSMTVPANVSKMWMVVAPSPNVYQQHKWDENITNDDQWPYHFRLTGTDLESRATVYKSCQIGDRGVGDVTLTLDVYLPKDMTASDSYTFALSDDALIPLGTALQMMPTAINNKMQAYSEEGPDPGKLMFYPYKSGSLVESPSNNGSKYGHWFSRIGNLVEADDSKGWVSSSFDPSSLSFTLAINPDNVGSSTTAVTSRQALRYIDEEGNEAIALFILRTHLNSSTTTSASLYSVQYDEQEALPVEAITVESDDAAYYDLSGRHVANPTRAGIYIHQGRKVLIK